MRRWAAAILGLTLLGAARQQAFTLRLSAHIVEPEARAAAVRASDAALRAALLAPALVTPPAGSAAPAQPPSPPSPPSPPVVPLPREPLQPERMAPEPARPVPERMPAAPNAVPLTPPLAPVPREAVPPARTLDPTQMPVEPADLRGRDTRGAPQGTRPEAPGGGGPNQRPGQHDGPPGGPGGAGVGHTRDLVDGDGHGNHGGPGDESHGSHGGPGDESHGSHGGQRPH